MPCLRFDSKPMFTVDGLTVKTSLGCDVLRLDHFIDDYYKDSGSGSVFQQQTDYAFKSFVWSLIIQEPTVTVGLVPEGSAPVCIAPQPSAVRKSKANAASSATLSITSPAALQALDPREVADVGLEDLVAKHGNTLRIAVDHETCFVAITGSHVRPSKLGPMAYTALQFITRTRTDGIPMKALGDATGYDQKTIHYVVSQLVTLGYVYKIRTRGVSKHSCIHQHFYEKSSIYIPEQPADVDVVPMEDDDEQTQLQDDGASSVVTKEQSFDTKAEMFVNAPIERRDLENEALVRGRLTAMLKASPNNLIRKDNLLLSLGFLKPSTKDRRFFTSLLRDFAKRGFVDMVQAPHHSDPTRTVTCIRLKEKRAPIVPNIVKSSEENSEVQTGRIHSSPANTESRPSTNVSMEYQIIRLVSESGTRGMSLNDLHGRLGFLEKRTLDQFLARFERDTPPLHLAKSGIVQMVETVKREHRAKYYTLDNYLQVMGKHGLQDIPPRYAAVDLSQDGEWAAFTAEQFYAPGEQGRTELRRHMEVTVTAVVTKQPKATGLKARVNPLGPDGKPKRGRPRKETTQPGKKQRTESNAHPAPPAAISAGKVNGKRKRSEADLDDDQLPQHDVQDLPTCPIVKERGRPPKPKATSLSSHRSSQPPLAGVPSSSKNRAPKSDGSAMEDMKRDFTPITTDFVRKVTEPNVDTSLSHVADALQLENQLEDAPVVCFSGADGLVDAVPQVASLLFHDRPERRQLSSAAGVSNGKHGLLQEPDTREPPSKRAKFSNLPTEEQHTAPNNPRKFSVNVSYMRREKEVLHILEETNGIAVLDTKDFISRHAALLEEWATAGLETSAPPGTRLDKRTLRTLVQTMENRRTLKIIKTAIKHKHTTLFYLPTISEDSVHSFIRGLQTSPRMINKASTDIVNEQYQYKVTKKPPTKEKDHVPASDQELVNRSPIEVRVALLSDAKTSAQLFGYIVGQIVRARELHLYTLSRLTDSDDLSSSFTSTTEMIFQTKYFWEDIPISTFCSFVPIIDNPPDLEDFLATPEGGRTKVRDLPRPLADTLEVGRTRCRAKVTEILRILQGLGLALPLIRARGTSPAVSCTAADGTLISFDIFNDPLIPVPNIEYWQFKKSAPIYHLADSSEHPLLCGEWPTATVDEGVEYWLAAYQASHDAAFSVDAMNITTSEAQLFPGGDVLAKAMRGTQSWSPKYFLGARQRSYLSRFLNHETGQIPRLADPEDRNDPFNVLCFAVAASREAVLDYFEHEGEHIARRLHRQEERDKRTADKETRRAMKRQAAARKLLGQKAQEVKVRMEQDWNDAVAAVHPEPLTEEQSASPSLARVRKSFFAAGGLLNLERVRKGIASALELGCATSAINAPPARPALLQEATRPLVQAPRRTGTKAQKSIADLIAIQDPIEKETSKEKRQRRASTKGETTGRRQRFVWTPDLDDLAQDAVAVVGARCRRHGKMNWQAVDQVFPGINCDGVRQRILRLRTDPATETYIMNLEQAWYIAWKANRGTDSLPDEHPENARSFDLITHIEYLRQHINKEQLRSGGGSQPRRGAQLALPASVDTLLDQFDLVLEKREFKWDFMWNVLGDDVRERSLLGESITEGMCSLPQVHTLDEMGAFTEAAIKMTLETEEAVYDQDVAKGLLDALGEELVVRAHSHMQERNMLTRVEEVLSGPVNPKVYRGARTMEDSWTAEITDQEPQELSYVIDDGGMAALIQLVSDHKLDISIDTSNAANARPELNGNSKKVVDDQLETSLTIKLRPQSSLNLPARCQEAPLADQDIQPSGHAIEVQSGLHAHGFSAVIPDAPASCVESKESTAVLVDCGACLNKSRMKVLASMSEGDRLIAEDVVERVQRTGARGFGIQDGLLTASIDARLTSGPMPLLFWTGYSYPILVSCEHLRSWTVASRPSTTNPVPMVFPRRWIDIHGDVIERVWKSALRSVAGWVYNRPGISVSELRTRLAPVLDRLEVLDLLRHLQEVGVIESRWGDEVKGEGLVRDLRGANEQESQMVSLNVVNGSWYRLEV
ncbi:hypothetical protein FRB96_005223 [Tulasnella sp. 330]|nr:hypothetical protein FRB96_005223 [Tulasnella sp. 330]